MQHAETSVAGARRAEWQDLPPRVRAAFEGWLGSRVVSTVNQRGGFSPGLAALVRCADGAQVFVKAVSSSLNSISPRMHREEAKIAAALPSHAPVPRLRYAYDDGDWVLLAFDAIEGETPETPWQPDDVRRVLKATALLADTLTPCPLANVPTARERLEDAFFAYQRLADRPDVLSAWERRNLDRLMAAPAAVLDAMEGNTLIHLDIRADNVIFARDGGVFFVDWAWGSRAAPWIDPVCVLVSVATYGRIPERYIAADPLLATTNPAWITSFLIGLAAMWAEAVSQPPPPGLPTLRSFQQRERNGTLSWIRSRTRWP